MPAQAAPQGAPAQGQAQEGGENKMYTILRSLAIFMACQMGKPS
jgi:hypothetical protein